MPLPEASNEKMNDVHKSRKQSHRPTSSRTAPLSVPEERQPGQPRPGSQSTSTGHGVVAGEERRLSLKQMKELAETQMKKRKEEQEQQETSKMKTSKKIMIVAGIAVFIGAIALFLLFSGPKRTATQLQIKEECITLDCRHHIFLLNEGMDASVDPCDNFTAHVCGNAKGADGRVISTERSMMMDWIKNGAIYLGSSKFHFNVTKKAEALFTSCKNTRKAEIQDIKTFMRERGLHWPDKAVPNRHPLDVVLDLYINWGVVFWFEISLLTPPNETRISISFSRSDKAKFARERVQSVQDKMSRFIYADYFYAHYSDELVSRTDLEQLFQTEDAVLNILVGNVLSSPRRILMHQIETPTPNILRDKHWIPFLNRHLGSSYKIVEEDQVLLEDDQLLIDINTIFRKFSHAELLDHLGWWFAQEYLILAVSDTSYAMHVYEKQPFLFLPFDCYAEVENHYRSLLFIERRLSKVKGYKDTRIPREIIDSAVTLLEKNRTWALQDGGVHDAIGNVKKVSLRPQLPAGTDGRIAKYFEAMYRSHPSSDRSFIRLWIETARAVKKIPGWPLNDTLLHRPATSSSIMKYDMWLHSIFVHESAFTPPAFYEDGLLAINYGGLGAQIALHVVKALHRKESQIETSWNATPKVTQRLRVKPACDSIDHKVLLQVAAVQIALSAYVAGGGEMASSYKNLQHLSLQQVFFYTHCKTMCGQGDYCSDTLRHLDAFGSAFQCPEDSFMNPSQKCTYFE